MKIILRKIIEKCPYFALLCLSLCVAFVISPQLGYRGIRNDVAELQNTVYEKFVEYSYGIFGKKEIHAEQVMEQQTVRLQTIQQQTIKEQAQFNETKTTQESEKEKIVASVDYENEGNLQVDANTIKNQDDKDNERSDTESGIKAEDKACGITRYEYYTPKVINSPYYKDAGKIAITTDFDYDTVDVNYFDDAVFIGDSRTVGISEYVGFENADFFCENSMTIYKMLDDRGITDQRLGHRVDLKQVMQQKQYGKIYIMVGINELGYYNTDKYRETFEEVIKKLMEWQPDAIIYLLANLHVAREKNNDEKVINNTNLNDKNAALASLADGYRIFYLDCNPLFTDEEGFLRSDYSFDGIHLYAKHYDKWREFLLSHAVIRD